jgi:hypothetical protein
MKKNRIWAGFVFLSGVITFLGLQCSPNSPEHVGNSTQTGNGMIAGVIYNKDGSFARNAKVTLRKKKSLADTSGVLLKKLAAPDTAAATTNDSGKFVIDSIDTGVYIVVGTDGGNNLSQNDSVPVKNKDSTVALPPDTLKPAGAIKGVINLSEGGDPRKVIVLAFGVDKLARVNTDGSFKISFLAEGKYDLRLISTLDNYGVLDTLNIHVKSADTTNLDTIQIPFTGIPTPKGLRISYDSLVQIVRVSWNKIDSNLARGFNIYRRNTDSNTIFSQINSKQITDTFYLDTTGIANLTYEYQIASVSKANMEGAKSAAISIKITSPIKFIKNIGTSGDGIGKYTLPSAIVADSNGILIADYSKGKILFYDTAGTFLKEITGLNNPIGLSIKNRNSIFVIEESGTIKCIDSIGNVTFQISTTPSSGTNEWNLAIAQNGYLYVPDMANGQIIVFDSVGIQKSIIPATSPLNISFIQKNEIAVGSASGDTSKKIFVVDTNGIILKNWATSSIFDVDPTLNNNIICQNGLMVTIFSIKGAMLLRASMNSYLGQNQDITHIHAGIGNVFFMIDDYTNVRIFTYPSQL